jgi:hypothetical protein
MSYFLIALFLLLFVPIILMRYNKDKGENNSAKVFNLIVSLFLLYSFAGTTKLELTQVFTGSQKLTEKVFVEVGILSPFISGFSWLLYVTLSFVLSVIIIQVAFRKEKSRKIFLRILPFYWILNSINVYKYIIPKNDVVSNSDYLIPGILILNSFFIILIYVFYSRSFVKKFFQFRE